MVSLVQAQSNSPDLSDSLLYQKRTRAMLGFQLGSAAAVSSGLYFLWYSKYDLGGFHWINDNPGWLQMDKVGHTVTNYQVIHKCYSWNRWAGMDKKKALIWSASVAYGFQSLIEFFDGLSVAWGASAGDIAANTLGLASFVSQELAWDEQRILWKFSFRPNNYSQYGEEVQTRAEKLYGTTIYESLLKDYNYQTYWLSANISSFAPNSEWLPKWLNVAVGYSGEGLLGANWNVWYGENECFQDFETIPRYRQYYLSLDIDWTRMKSKRKWFKTVAPFLNILKIPFPAIEYSRIDGLKGKAFYF